MASKRKITIKLQGKKPWEVSRGHSEHRGGSGSHDSRPKRKRTRKAQLREALREHGYDYR